MNQSSRSPKRYLPSAAAVVALLAAAAAFRAFRSAPKPLPQPRNSAEAWANKDIDLGSPAGSLPAPNFKLRDQNGRVVSLSQFRGKAVMLAFIDSHCTSICPLMTQSMTEALRFLGPAAARVQIVGINANPSATKISDVAAYTRAHGMRGRWRFLTGRPARLKRVWRAYHVYVAAIHGDIDHQPIIFLIGPDGRERAIYSDRMSYEGVVQQAQILADGIARILPGRPTVQNAVSLAPIPAMKPEQSERLPAVGAPGHFVDFGAGHPHLLLFFASWLDEDANLPKELSILEHYSTQARRRGWPAPVAIDERATEALGSAARARLARLASGLRVPLVEDARGRLAEGYGVEDMPWFALTSPSGRILWSRGGWLSSGALERRVGAALRSR
ncbi:MAG: SCO family protein [Elusimicrobia bacterium]|nr:SCO family protein [Elusimicrobiota bacterium]